MFFTFNEISAGFPSLYRADLRYRTMRYILIFSLIVSLAACGRKPSVLQAPDSDVADAYPKVYPKPLPGEAAAIMPESDLVSKYRARPEQALQ